MIKPINGWTKQKMIEAIQTRMLDHRSYDHRLGKGCVYRAPDGNRCAVGVFIPDGHEAETLEGDVEELLSGYPELKEILPLKATYMQEMQRLHDKCVNGDPRPQLIAWIKENVA